MEKSGEGIALELVTGWYHESTADGDKSYAEPVGLKLCVHLPHTTGWVWKRWDWAPYLRVRVGGQSDRRVMIGWTIDRRTRFNAYYSGCVR